MRDVIRVVLVDPNDESRQALQRLLGSMGSVWIAEVFPATRSPPAASSRSPRISAWWPSTPSRAQAIELIASMVDAHPSAVVLPASASCDSTLILKSIRAGAREFLTLPTEAAELLEIITRLFRGRGDASSSAIKGPQIITVTGAAGGVGCTTLAVNLATSLAASRDHETILLDFDLMFGSVDACLDIIPDNTLINVVQNFDRLDLTLLKRSMTRHSLGPLRSASTRRPGGRRQDRSRDAETACWDCSRRPSHASSLTPARGSSRPTSWPSRWPT